MASQNIHHVQVEGKGFRHTHGEKAFCFLSWVSNWMLRRFTTSTTKRVARIAILGDPGSDGDEYLESLPEGAHIHSYLTPYSLKVSYVFEKWSDFDNIFGEDPDRLQVFCTHFQVHRTHFKKVTSKNVFFHFFKNGKKHTHDMKNSSSQTLTLWIFFILWIRVQTLNSYFFHYSKRDLELIWWF